MSLALEDVYKVARLARLPLSEEEAVRFQAQLAAVLVYVARIEELDLDGVPPTTRAVPRENVWREDSILPSLPREEALYNAPRQQDGQFLIPPVFDQ